MATAIELVRQAAATLPGDSPLLDAEVLFRSSVGWTRTQYLIRAEESIEVEVEQRYDALIQRRIQHEPVAYITGTKEFFGREFFVDSRVLIPRPDSEILVESALKIIDQRGAVSCLELATGSGCILTTLLLERPNGFRDAVASDISSEALDVAYKNFSRHGVTDRIQMCSSDWFSSIGGQYDLVIANPPYVETGAELEPDLKFEPSLALFAGPDGMRSIRAILKDFTDFLAPQGCLLMEFGVGQEDEIIKLAPQASFIPDLSGRGRVAIVPHLAA